MNTYVDKQKIASELCDSAEGRAARLKRLRNMANLSRKEMCNRSGIKPDTLIGWEVARHGGLTENGAKKVIECLANEGVQCTLNWLLYEIGSSPIVLPDFKNAKESFQKKEEMPSSSNEEKIIIDELLLFHNKYRNAINHKVDDDGMFPQYLFNDYVAGIKRYRNNIFKLIGYDCIVQLTDGKILLRCLREGTKKNRYTLLCGNIKTTVSMPILYDTEIVCAAPVIWIRRKNPEN